MSKKNIIAIVAIVVLLFIAGISVGIFLYNNAATEAVEGRVEPEIEENLNNGTAKKETENKDENITENTVENTVETNQNTTTANITTDVQTNNENQTADDVDGTTNDNLDVNEIGETTITRVEEEEKLVSQAFWDWWKPMEVKITPTKIGLQIPQIVVKKTAHTEVGDGKLVYAGQNITYCIEVTNNGETDVENIDVTDRIPEKTTFVSIEDATLLGEKVGTKTIINNENEIIGVKWVVSIPAGKTILAKFTVQVNEAILKEDEFAEMIGTISNVAIANGVESNEVKTSIIKTNKSSKIKRLVDKEKQEYMEPEAAMKGDLVTYKITVENTGDVEGTTYITDSIPKGTKFIYAEDDAILSEAKDSIKWKVTIPANEVITREFTVEVEDFEGKQIKNIAYVGGTPTNEDIIQKEGIILATKIAKTNSGTVTVVEGNEMVTTGDTAVKIGDTIEYTIQLENIGNTTKTAKVKDTIPGHTELLQGTTIYLNKVPLTSEEINKLYNGTLEIEVKPNEKHEITFKVKVVSGNAGETVQNTVIVNNKEVGPTINPIEKLVNVTKFKNNIASTNIVLVLDTSSSMLRYPNNEENAPEGERRIDIAKNAIIAFVENTYKIEKNKDVTFTLITFDHRDNTKLFTFDDGNNTSAWLATKSTQTKFKEAVKKITTGRGTNMAAGLEVAYETIYGKDKLASMNEYNKFEKILIFFGDGEPYTEREKGQPNTNEGIGERAKKIRDKGTKVYSIAFGPDVKKGENGYDRLSDIANGEDNVYNSEDYQTLVKDFSRIAGKDPSYEQITVDGSAKIEIKSDVQNIVVDTKNPIIINVGSVKTTITTPEQAEANNIKYTQNSITWNVSSYGETAELSISYNVE